MGGGKGADADSTAIFQFYWLLPILKHYPPILKLLADSHVYVKDKMDTTNLTQKSSLLPSC